MNPTQRDIAHAFRKVKADILALQGSLVDMNMKISELFVEVEKIKDKIGAKNTKTKKSRK